MQRECARFCLNLKVKCPTSNPSSRSLKSEDISEILTREESSTSQTRYTGCHVYWKSKLSNSELALSTAAAAAAETEKGELKPGGARAVPEDACGACWVRVGRRRWMANALVQARPRPRE
eukprot:scaffold11221_cov144-Skeletonema_dohrnii-CCMP3373.AAC.3